MLAETPSSRILAMRRGENEGMLSLKITVPEEDAYAILDRLFVYSDRPSSRQVRLAVHDAYKRLLGPSDGDGNAAFIQTGG